MVEEVLFEPQSPLAEHVAVVRGDHDRGVPRQVGCLQGVQKSPDHLVEVRAVGEIGVASGADMVRRDAPVEQTVVDEHALAVEIALRRRQQRGRRHRDVLVPVTVPVLALRAVRLVGMSEGCEQKERPAIRIAREIVEPGHCPVEHRLVVVHLHAAHAGPGPGDATRIVVRIHADLVPARRPVEVGGIELGHEPLVEPVQHVRPDEVLLAGQRGVVPGEAQPVRHGGGGGREFRPVVESADTRRQHPGQHRKA